MAEQVHDPLAEFEVRKADAAWTSRIVDFDLSNFGRDAWPESVWETELAGTGRTFVLVFDPPTPVQSVGSLVAVGGVSHGPEAEILTIAVAERFRRRGIGRALLATLIGEAQAHHATDVYLEVRASDKGTQALYESAGFVAVGLRKRYYSNDDAVVMHLNLLDFAGL